jgi:hypothetical protein
MARSSHPPDPKRPWRALVVGALPVAHRSARATTSPRVHLTDCHRGGLLRRGRPG